MAGWEGLGQQKWRSRVTQATNAGGKIATPVEDKEAYGKIGGEGKTRTVHSET